MKEIKEKKPRLGLIGLGLFFLIIPGVNVYDILPDFIAYFLFYRALSFSADRAPYFAESRDAFFKLGVVTFIKIPAALAMSFIRSSNSADSDIRSLFSITFAVIELILIFTAVRNLFLGFTYLGERTDNGAFISDIALNKKGSRKTSPDALRNLTNAFAFYRAVMYFVPELFLLTRGVSAEEYYKTFNIAKLYPYAVIFSLVTVLIFGIVWQRRMKKYIRAIKSFGGLSASADTLLTDESRAELYEAKKISGMKLSLTILVIAAFLSCELRFENLHNVDLLPSFIFGFVIMLASARLGSYVGTKKQALIAGGVYTGVAFVTYLFDFTFFKDYAYSDILLYPAARRSYIALIVARSAETLTFILIMAVLCYTLTRFVKLHMGIEPESEKYSRQDREYHKRMTTFAYISCSLGILSQLARLADCIFKYFTKSILVDMNNAIGTVSEGLVPWFGVVVLLLEIAYIGFTLYTVSTFKEEVDLKYSLS